jgi:hypothetical protein
MKRIQTEIVTKETVELEKAVAIELQENNKDQEKAIALLLGGKNEEDESEDSQGIHRTGNS